MTSSWRPAPRVGGLAVLQRIASAPRRQATEQRCELCGEPIAHPHQHLVNLEARNLVCACRPCYLLFTDSTARLSYRAVPDRYLHFEDFDLSGGQWQALEVPVNLAFFFSHSGLGRTIAFYPGPAGATESELGLSAWEAVLASNPGLGTLAVDVEALLVRVDERGSGAFDCYLVPIDACYELVGQLRQVWRGFDGGQEARDRVNGFFSGLADRSRTATAQAGQAPS